MWLPQHHNDPSNRVALQLQLSYRKKTPYMKLNFTRLVTLCLFVSLIIFSTSCKKSVDQLYDLYKKDHAQLTTYIKKISVQANVDGGTTVVNYAFSYNAVGNPTTVKNTAVGTGNPNVVFKYDRYGRLSEMIRPYDNGIYESWTKYVYDVKNQIVRDTQYVFGTYKDSVAVAYPEYGYWTDQYVYDSYGRISTIIDSSFYDIYSEGGSTSYAYDTKGNLVKDGVTYDAGMNFALINKVWMFVCNSYCVNNGFTATSYTKEGLPLSFAGTPSSMMWIVPLTGKFDITYGQW
jgi:hypothetical protein